jgi:hypothetical protein
VHETLGRGLEIEIVVSLRESEKERYELGLNFIEVR